MAFVYILQSLKSGRYYIGSTRDLKRRFMEHNAGYVDATRNFLPFQLVFYQVFDALEVARAIEAKLKRLKRKDYIAKIVKDGFIREIR